MEFEDKGAGIKEGREGAFLAQVGPPETGWATMMFKDGVLFALIPPSPNFEEAARRIELEMFWAENGIDPAALPS